MGYVLVTGGAGYIGSHTVIELISAGFTPVIVDNLCNAFVQSVDRVRLITNTNVPFHKVDLTAKEALRDVFAKYDFKFVIHFAGLKSLTESCEDPMQYYLNNFVGTMILCDVMREFGVYNVVFSSSATVYGPPQYLPIDEQHPVGDCTNPYGRTKYFNEHLLRDLSDSDKRWNIILLRYFNPVGAHKSGLIGEDPQGPPNNLLPYVSQVAVGRRPYLTVFGNDYDTPDGTGVRDYIHVVDLATAHVAALRKLSTTPHLGCKVYNVGTGKGYSVMEMIEAFSTASGKKITYKVGSRRPMDVASCYSNPQLAAKELGWTAKRELKKMCEDSWRWQSKNPNGFLTENPTKIASKTPADLVNNLDQEAQVANLQHCLVSR